MLSSAAAPCALFAMGVTAAMRPLKRIPRELGYLVPIKLIAHPVLVYLVVSSMPDIPSLWLHSAVLLAALPSATNVFVLAQQYDDLGGAVVKYRCVIYSGISCHAYRRYLFGTERRTLIAQG